MALWEAAVSTKPGPVCAVPPSSQLQPREFSKSHCPSSVIEESWGQVNTGIVGLKRASGLQCTVTAENRCSLCSGANCSNYAVVFLLGLLAASFFPANPEFVLLAHLHSTKHALLTGSFLLSLSTWMARVTLNSRRLGIGCGSVAMPSILMPPECQFSGGIPSFVAVLFAVWGIPGEPWAGH